MVAPDWFLKLLEALGLRESEAKKEQRKKAENEEAIRGVRSAMDDLEKRAEDLIAELMVLKNKFEKSTGAIKDITAAKIRDVSTRYQNLNNELAALEKVLRGRGAIEDANRITSIASKHLSIIAEIEEAIAGKEIANENLDIIDDLTNELEGTKASKAASAEDTVKMMNDILGIAEPEKTAAAPAPAEAAAPVTPVAAEPVPAAAAPAPEADKTPIAN